MLPKASSSSNMSGLIGGGGGIIWDRGEEFVSLYCEYFPYVYETERLN